MSGILLASVGNSYGSLPVNIVAPAVTGTATVGQTLSTTNGTWTGAPAPTFSYQWQRNGVNISGATSSTYLLVDADFNNPIRCVVTATNPLGAVSANSNATANVAGIIPSNTVAPVVSGTAAVGQTLSTTNGTWAGAPAPTFAYQWQRNNVNISGATSSTYLLVAADFNNPIRCVVTATNAVGSASANSNATANVAGSVPVNTVAPAISGSATVGSTLTTSDGTWTGTPAPTFAYQWQRATTNISGATSSTYVVQLTEVGNTIRCVVTATNVAGSASANTANTASVPLPAIGSATGGGFFAGQIGVSSVATHYLIVGPLSTAQTVGPWKTTRTVTAGTNSAIDGPANSIAANNAAHPCAQFCKALNLGGFTDWYLPAQNELEVCYFNLKPSTQENNTFYGANPNAVPARTSGYTNSPQVPPQTSAAAFQSGGADAFLSTHWTSTQSPDPGRDALDAVAIGFGNGNQYTSNNKTTYLRARAVRRVPV